MNQDWNDLSDEAWRERLTPEQYAITRGNGTERAFSGAYWNEKRDGVYYCICCNLRLFQSADKFDSGTGWPSFFQSAPESIAMASDSTHGMQRTEIRCRHCHAHLGHVFDDGPPPTGLRYCVNSASLRFEPET